MKAQNNWIKGTLYLGFYIGAIILLLTSCKAKLDSTEAYNIEKITYPTFTLADSLKGNLSPLRTNFDVTYYDLKVDIDIDQKFIQGSVNMYFTAVNDLDTIQIDLYNNMNIESILHNAQELSFRRVHNAVFVSFPKKIKKGAHEIIDVHYSGNPVEAKDIPWEGGFVWGKDAGGKPWVTVACEYEGASLWWPLKDHRSDKPDSLCMQFSVPSGLFCVSNGKLIKRESKQNKEVFTWKSSYPANTDNAALYIGDFTHFQIPYTSDYSSFNMDFYVLNKDIKKSMQRFSQTTEIMSTYENLFGAYPWIKDGFKLVESPHKAIQNQKAIPANQDMATNANYKFEQDIVQKTAREWWGNSLSVKDLADVWIRESFSLYSEALFIEQKDGKDAYLRFFSDKNETLENHKPLVGPKNVNYWDSSDENLALKGAKVLHTLRNKISDDSLFFSVLKSFYTENAYTAVNTEDFTKLVTSKCQDNYSVFFEQYLYSNVCPGLEWQYLYNKKLKKEYVFYRWKNVDEHFDLPILIETSNVTFRIRPELNIKAVEIPAGDTIFMNINESLITLDYNKNMIKYQQ